MIGGVTGGRVHSRRPAGWFWLITIMAFAGLAWAVFGAKQYYRWALGGRRIDINIFCDTSALKLPETRALILYDKVALNPLAKALGVLQNRDPDDVKDFLVVPADDVEITPVSARIKSVPYGPICRLMFVAGGKKFHVDVKNRWLIDNTIYVRVSDKSLMPDDTAEE